MRNSSKAALLLPMAVVLTTGLAFAGPLDDGVAAYNSSASSLQGSWDDYQDAQDAAFSDVDDWLTNMYNYVLNSGDDDEAADDYWDAQAAAAGHMLNNAGAPMDAALAALITDIQGAASLLDILIVADAADSSHTVYATGSFHLQIPAGPIAFWKDSTPPSETDWIDFDFPVLAVGDNSHTSYTTGGQTLEALLDDYVEDMEDFLQWAYEHYQLGDEINQDGSNMLSVICAVCWSQISIALVKDDCFTEQSILDFCEEEET